MFAASFMCLFAGQPLPENPWLKAKVGDSITYVDNWKSTKPISDSRTTMMTKTVTKKTNDKVLLKLEAVSPGITFPVLESEIDLKEKYDPLGVPPEAQFKSKKLGQGKEKIKVGGKTYDCTWFSVEVTLELNGKTIVTQGKGWYSKDVPLDGLVKSTSTGDGFETTLEAISVTYGK